MPNLNEMRTIAGRRNLVKNAKMHVDCGILAEMPANHDSSKGKNGGNASCVEQCGENANNA